MSINLVNFDPNGSKKINSPRSLEACRRQGIDPGELFVLKKAQIKKANKGAHPKVLELRTQHYEEKRKEKIRILTEEREAVIQDEDNDVILFDKTSGHFKSVHRSMMTSASNFANESVILDREKKQMEAMQKKQKKELDQMMQNKKLMEEREEKQNKKIEKDREIQRKRQAELLARQEKTQMEQTR